MKIGGVKVQFRASGALWLEDSRTLVVADLHLEKGSAYARRGQMLPPYDTGETLGRLRAEVDALRPTSCILLGDSLHDPWATERLPEVALRSIAGLAESTHLVWIIGNHDREGLGALPGETAAEVKVGDLTFRHEPLPGADHAWASGHLHPCARVRGLRRRCFVTDGARIVLPAFGAFAGGLNVRDAAYDGLFSKNPTALVLGQARAYAVPWARLAPD